MIFDYILLVALCMAFEGSPCPSIWGVISETITDVGNVLLQKESWNHNEMFEPISSTWCSCIPSNFNPLPPSPGLISSNSYDNGKVDIYIDDSIEITPELGDAPSRVVRAIPLAFHSLSWPPSVHDIIPRKDIISLKKLHTEGQLSEVKTVLGWTIDTRSLTISLAAHKVTDWSHDINSILSSRKADYKLLE